MQLPLYETKEPLQTIVHNDPKLTQILIRACSYHRMDGCTSISQRSRLVDDFNNNPRVFLFLLTTKVRAA